MELHDLPQIRREIDEANSSLMELFERRLDLVRQVAEYKEAYSLPVFDGAREKEVLQKCVKLVQSPEHRDICLWLMEKVMEASRRYESGNMQTEYAPVRKTPAVKGVYKSAGYQGVPGSYSHQALRNYFKDSSVEEYNFKLFKDVITAVSRKEIDCGVLPIENSSTGGILEVYDLLRKSDCRIVGEKIVKVDHNLMVSPGVKLEDITKVYSHPQGFSQCAEFFADHREWELIPYFNTARSAEMVSRAKDPHSAAVASREAAELYGLDILAANINSNARNYTRFVVVAASDIEDDEADKITIVIGLRHKAGALSRALAYFSNNGLNLTNLESRPRDDGSWEYFFHLDFMGRLEEENVERAMEGLKEETSYLKVLGNYRSDRRS